MADFDFNALPPEEQAKFKNMYLLNQAQGALASPGYQPDMSQYEFKKPDNVGQALGNVVKNRVINPVQEAFGYREPMSDVLNKMRIGQFQREQMSGVIESLNKTGLQNFFFNLGYPEDVIKNLGIDELRELATNRMSDPVTSPSGVVTQKNLLSGAQEAIITPAAEVQSFNLERNLRQQQNEAADGVSPPLRGAARPFPDIYNLTPSSLRMEEEERKADLNVQSQRNQKIDEKALTRIDDFTSPYYEGMRTAGNTRASIQQLSGLLDAGTKTGQVQDLLTYARGLGIDLGLNVENPSQQQVYKAIATQLIIPMMKQLGTQPTDRDSQLMLDSYPSLSLTPEGNRLLIDVMKLKLDRDEVMTNAIMDFEDENEQLLRQNPSRYKRQLERRLSEVQASDAYKANDMFVLKARHSALTGRSPDSQKALNAILGE